MHTPVATIMVADHDAQDRCRLRGCLERADYRVRDVSDGGSLLLALEREMPHLVVLDLQLPSVGGMELCRRIKRHGDVPLVIVTALEDEEVKLRTLDLYAEDYIQKPARDAEVVARVRRVLQRTLLSCLPPSSTVYVDDSLSLDFFRREARTPGGVSRLTPLESRLLQLLVRNSGQLLPNQLILERLWGDQNSCAGSLWEYVRRVRHKIGDDANRPRYLLNEPGLGYRFSPVTRQAMGGTR
ncbi:MAG TPA: response regulator transcription factor [Chloroflexota bacterium]|nr:response regulator transcription factor [Chloroflexota bacterium]